MKNVKPTKAWSFSLIISSVCSLIIAITGVIGIELPDMAKRIFGIIMLIALPVMVYTSVKMFMETKG